MPPTETELHFLTRDQILAHARTRGGNLRRQRQIIRAAAAVALMGIVSVPVIQATAGTTDKVNVVDQATTTTVPDGTALAPTSTTVTTLPATPLTTLPRTGSHAVTATPTTSTTVPAEPSRACSGDQITFTVSTDKASYGPGEIVKVTARLRNNTTHRCYLPTEDFFEVQDADGEAVSASQSGNSDYPQGAAFEGGEVITKEYAWDQRCDTCAGGTAPAGTYTAVVGMSSGSHNYGTRRATFELL